MKLKIYLLLVFILLIPFILSAESVVKEIGPYKQYECVRLPQTCSNCTYVNITSVLYPNSSIALEEQNMTKDGTEYYYDFCNTYDSGTYIVNGKADLNGVNTIWNYKLNINPYGKEENSVLDNALLWVFIVLSIMFLIFAFTFKMPSMAFISGILFTLLGIYTMIYGFNEVTNIYTRGASISIIGAGIIFMIVSAYEWILDS